MSLANRTIYKKQNGKYVYHKQDVVDFVPLTYGGWKRSQSLDKQDHFKTRIYTKTSRSGLSKVPKKVIYEDLDYGKKVVLTNFRRAKPDIHNRKKCNRKDCIYRI